MNTIKRVLLVALTLATTFEICVAQENTITPAPNIATWGDTKLDITKGLALYLDVPKEDRARLVAAVKGLDLNIEERQRPAKRHYLNLRIVELKDIAEASSFKSFEEGYTLDITAKGITIKATTAQGLYYGVQSLRELDRKSVV